MKIVPGKSFTFHKRSHQIQILFEQSIEKKVILQQGLKAEIEEEKWYLFSCDASYYQFYFKENT